jgi:hypothetical protein
MIRAFSKLHLVVTDTGDSRIGNRNRAQCGSRIIEPVTSFISMYLGGTGPVCRHQGL